MVFGQTKFGGGGVWTATATGSSYNADKRSYVRITSNATGADIWFHSSDSTRTAGGLTATSGAPIITQKWGVGNVLTIGTVDLGTAGRLVLEGNISSGAKLVGTITFGNASITGSNASGAWQASGANTSITFAATGAATASITGTGTNPVLKGIDGDSAVITLAKGHENGDGAALTVSNATIDLSTNGGIVFPYVASTPATLVLKGGGTPGVLKLGSGTTDNTNKNLTCDGKAVVISGTDVVIKAASGDAGAVAGLISGGTNDATITGQTTANNDVTIKKGATLAGS